MRFMNPVPVMSLVEVIRGQLTNPETCAAVRDLAVRQRKTPLEVLDYPGSFIGLGTCLAILEVMNRDLGDQGRRSARSAGVVTRLLP